MYDHVLKNEVVIEGHLTEFFWDNVAAIDCEYGDGGRALYFLVFSPDQVRQVDGWTTGPRGKDRALVRVFGHLGKVPGFECVKCRRGYSKTGIYVDKIERVK